MMAREVLPYWNVNVPQEYWTTNCPPSLQDLSAKDENIIATPDSEYHRATWDEVKACIALNRIDLFQRVPSALRKYRQYTHQLQQDYGSIMNFVLKERLQWLDLTPSGPPFSNTGATPAEIPICSETPPPG